MIKSTAVQEILAVQGKVTGLRYSDRSSNALHEQQLDGVFVQIGLMPNSDFVKDFIELTPQGEIVITEKNLTSENGVFACGDVTTVPYKQIVIAMGEGAKAALSAFEYLLKVS